jgi:hypothetical protein
VLGEAAERLRDIVRDRGLLGNDEGFGHEFGLEKNGFAGWRTATVSASYNRCTQDNGVPALQHVAIMRMMISGILTMRQVRLR